jgi:excisionase family DNA binding protein
MPKTNLSEPDSKNEPPPRLLSIRQAARELGICRTGTYALLRDGKIKSVKIGRRLIPRDAIEAVIATLTKGERLK